MYDEAAPQFLLIVRQHLNHTSGEQWIGCGGPVNCPARSPDFNPLDFWLWDHLKFWVYSALNNELEVLQQRTEIACQVIRVKRGIFDRVRTSARDEELKVVFRCIGTT
jgi:hypothetical protein